jgi:hypothetical protein
MFIPVVWHSTDKYRKLVLRCGGRYLRPGTCKTPTLLEDEIKSGFVRLIRKLCKDKEGYIGDIESMRESPVDLDRMQAELVEMIRELEELAKKAQVGLYDYARSGEDRHNSAMRQYEAKLAEKQALENMLKAARAKNHGIDTFISAMRKMDSPIKKFDLDLWAGLIEEARVQDDGSITYHLRSGIAVNIKTRNVIPWNPRKKKE